MLAPCSLLNAASRVSTNCALPVPSAVLCCVSGRLAPHSDSIKNLTATAVQHRLAPVAPAFLLLGFSIWLLGPLLRWVHHAFHLVCRRATTLAACTRTRSNCYRARAVLRIASPLWLLWLGLCSNDLLVWCVTIAVTYMGTKLVLHD